MAKKNDTRCLACGGMTFESRQGDEVWYVCTHPGCTFSESGLRQRDYNVAKSLIESAYRAGYQSALEDVKLRLDKMNHG